MKRGTFKKKNYKGAVRVKTSPKRKKKPTLRKELDKLFSLFIRQRRASDDGMNSCYTCGLVRHWKELQCGHFVPRQYLAVRYDEINCQPQCYACNMLYNGQPSAFAVRLKRDYGEDIVEKLESRRQEITKDFPYELKILHYETMLK